MELGGQQPGGFNPFLSLPTERNACDYKRGYVIRKAEDQIIKPMNETFKVLLVVQD